MTTPPLPHPYLTSRPLRPYSRDMNTIKLAAILRVQATAEALAVAQRRVEHLEWLLSPSRCAQPMGANALATELMMLKGQDFGNLMVDLRQATAAAEVSR